MVTTKAIKTNQPTNQPTNHQCYEVKDVFNNCLMEKGFPFAKRKKLGF
jgi:hypothetical protein